MYAVIPVTIDFVNLQYTGKSTLLQMWGHFILSKVFECAIEDVFLFDVSPRKSRADSSRQEVKSGNKISSL